MLTLNMITKEFEQKLLKKIFDKIDVSNWKNAKTEGEFELISSGICENSFTINYTRVFNKTYESQLKTKRNTHHDDKVFYFITEIERHNFFNSYYCNFIKWFINVWKTDIELRNEYIPFTGDYSHVWVDEDWMDWFELTEDEREFVKLEIYRLGL